MASQINVWWRILNLRDSLRTMGLINQRAASMVFSPICVCFWCKTRGLKLPPVWVSGRKEPVQPQTRLQPALAPASSAWMVSGTGNGRQSGALLQVHPPTSAPLTASVPVQAEDSFG